MPRRDRRVVLRACVSGHRQRGRDAGDQKSGGETRARRRIRAPRRTGAGALAGCPRRRGGREREGPDSIGPDVPDQGEGDVRGRGGDKRGTR